MKLFRKNKNGTLTRDKKPNPNNQIAEPLSTKVFDVYRGFGSPGGELRVERIQIVFKKNKCHAIFSVGDFSPMGGTGFECSIPETVLKELTEEKLGAYFNRKLTSWKVQIDATDIHIPEELLQYFGRNPLYHFG